jgi:hypothetical protein
VAAKAVSAPQQMMGADSDYLLFCHFEYFMGSRLMLSPASILLGVTRTLELRHLADRLLFRLPETLTELAASSARRCNSQLIRKV